MSPSKQARGDNGKEPKLNLWQNGEKNLGGNQAQSGGQFPSGQTNQQFVPTAAKSESQQISVLCVRQVKEMGL